VRVELEHRDGRAIIVVLPYSIDTNNSVVEGELYATVGERQWWPAP
jgi:hypothetical protein